MTQAGQGGKKGHGSHVGSVHEDKYLCMKTEEQHCLSRVCSV